MPAARFPFLEGLPCTAAFLFTLTFIVFEKMFSTALRQRVRGATFSREILIPTRLLDGDAPLLKVFAFFCNIVFCYKLLKQFKKYRYVVSISRLQSRLTGYICKLPIVPCFRRPILGLFSSVYGVKIEEAQRDRFEQYTTFTDFFTRTLKPDARQIVEKNDKTSICSPCDGRVLTQGKVSTADSTIDCVKGRSYRLDEFLLGYIGDPEDKDDTASKIASRKNNSSVQALLDNVSAKGNELHYMVIYLSPGDYHRFHSPAIHTGHYRRHIAGYLSPVKPSYVNKHRDVFKNNERVNIFGEWKKNDFFFTSFVGALNVGSILLDFDSDVVTNVALPKNPYFTDKAYRADMTSPLDNYLNESNKETCGSVHFTKGEMTGRFEMGSTIVLIYEVPKSTTTLIQEGEAVVLGQQLVLTQ